MEMNQADEPPVSVSHLTKSCCTISQAPLPEAQTWAGNFDVATPPALASTTVVTTQPVASRWVTEIAWESSPPPLRSLLCTFLI